jgi:hypothetical protein
MGKLLVQDDDDAEAVVNDQIFAGVRELPAMSFTPVVTVAVYDVEGDNDDAGTNVATKPFNDTAPAIEVLALSFRVNVEVLTVPHLKWKQLSG